MQIIKHPKESTTWRIAPSLNAWRGIPGYFDENDVAAIRSLTENKQVFEIGTMYGRSTVAIAAVAALVVSVDNYTGDGMVAGRDPAQVKALVEGSFGDNCMLIQGDWTEVLPDYTELPLFDVYFYDAAHTPEDGPYEKHFLEMVEPLVDSTIVLHDYIPDNPAFRHVVEAIDAFEARTGRKRQGPCPNSSLVWFE